MYRFQEINFRTLFVYLECILTLYLKNSIFSPQMVVFVTWVRDFPSQKIETPCLCEGANFENNKFFLFYYLAQTNLICPMHSTQKNLTGQAVYGLIRLKRQIKIWQESTDLEK